MNDLELAVLLCPSSYFRDEKDKEFWLGRARLARMALQPKGFWFARRTLPVVQWLRALGSNAKLRAGLTSPPVREGKVRLHPLPEGASRPLASVIGAAVAGAIRDCLNQHPVHNMTRAQKGLLIGSSRKRAVNQLVCDEGVTRIQMALNGHAAIAYQTRRG